MPAYASIPAPIDGLNLRSSPYALAPTEAQQLDNYLVFDWGIRECGAMAALSLPSANTVEQIVFFRDLSGNAKQLVCLNNKIYLVTSVNWGGPSDLTGALTITSNAWRYCFFKSRIFLVNGTDAGLVYNISAGTLAADTWSGTTSENFSQCWSYKQRFYAIKKNSTSFVYGGLEAVSGAVTEYDLSVFMEEHGTLLFGTSWSVNQGNYNEVLNVIVTTAGEVLVYSGDDPAADNWAIVTRVTIPTPIGNQAFIRLGQDILIVTRRGVLSLAAVIAGRGEEEAYFNKSIKLADTFQGANIRPARDPSQPFIYFVASSSKYIYILNFERGAWSRLVTTSGSETITAISFYDNDNPGRYLNICWSNSTGKYMDDTGGNSVGHTWLSGFMAIEPNRTKQLHKVRAIGRNLAGTAQFKNSIGVYFDVPTAPIGSDAKTTTTTGTSYADQELFPTGAGRRPALLFDKTSAGEWNEIIGVDLFYSQVGGNE